MYGRRGGVAGPLGPVWPPWGRGRSPGPRMAAEGAWPVPTCGMQITTEITLCMHALEQLLLSVSQSVSLSIQEVSKMLQASQPRCLLFIDSHSAQTQNKAHFCT